MTVARLNGIDVYFEVHGAGPAVLLTHGYGWTSQAWAPQIPALEAAGWQIVSWDARGHGRTESPDDPAAYSDAATVADMAAILDHLGIGKAVIGGLSMGGYMSMQFALAHPDRVRALVLCDTGPGYRNPHAREAWNATARERAVRLREVGVAALNPSSSTREHRSAEGLAKASLGMVVQDHDGVLGKLGTVSAPALVVVGERDEPFFNAIDYIASRIPNARKVVIPDAGHVSNVDNPEAFNAALVEFLTSLGDG